MRPRAVIALACALLVSGCGVGGSARDYVRENYPREGKGNEKPVAYRSDKPPSQTAADIAKARKPADRRTTASGVFLRYQKDMVGVVPNGRVGSRVLVDDERHGYGFFFPYVGGFWGRSSGRGEGFRGGGPGSGK